MKWCEDHGVGFVLGLARNQRLVRALGLEMHEARSVHRRAVEVFVRSERAINNLLALASGKSGPYPRHEPVVLRQAVQFLPLHRRDQRHSKETLDEIRNR